MRPFASALLWLLIWAGASDVAGEWKLSYTSDDGQTHESTLYLKVDGEKLSGKIASARGSAPIADGRISGDDISFTLNRRGHGEDITVSYTGKVNGDAMALTLKIGEREPLAVKATRLVR